MTEPVANTIRHRAFAPRRGDEYWMYVYPSEDDACRNVNIRRSVYFRVVRDVHDRMAGKPRGLMLQLLGRMRREVRLDMRRHRYGLR